MPESSLHVSRFLRRNQVAGRLLEGLERDMGLQRRVRRALDPELRTHCLHAIFDGGRLTLVSDSPVWASRLRFGAPGLMAALGVEGLAVKEVRVRVVPQAAVRPGPARRPALTLSPGVVAHLLGAADAMDDPDLAAALRRLARAGSGESFL
jgi:hypothetical protein